VLRCGFSECGWKRREGVPLADARASRGQIGAELETALLRVLREAGLGRAQAECPAVALETPPAVKRPRVGGEEAAPSHQQRRRRKALPHGRLALPLRNRSGEFCPSS